MLFLPNAIEDEYGGSKPIIRQLCESPIHVGPASFASCISDDDGARICTACNNRRHAEAQRSRAETPSSLLPVASYGNCANCHNDRVVYVPGSKPARFVVCASCIPRDCPRCKGEGRYYYESRGYEYVAACPCRPTRSQEVAAFLTEAQFPGEFGPLLLGPLPRMDGLSEGQCDMHDRSLAWGRAWMPGCVGAPGFFGPPGTGKTLAQCRAAAHAVVCGNIPLSTPRGQRLLPPRVRFLAWPQWVQDAQDSIDDAEVKKESIRRFMVYDIIVFDELFYRDRDGALRPSPYKRELLASFLHAAQDKGISLLVATNCSEPELRAAIPESAFSRLSAAVTFIGVVGLDVRQLRKQQREADQ